MIDLGLQRISRLLSKTPLPWRAVHVAGTNGKGSICAYVSRMLGVYNDSSWRELRGQSRLRHARLTSPHLTDRWDCITLNHNPVTHSVFREVERLVLDRNRAEAINATEFEILTATAFEIFTREKVDIGVIEVGMGGRLDATNILGQSQEPPKGVNKEDFRPTPLVTIISSIGLDHQAFLGNTLEEIAGEKAGIIKPGTPVVFDDTNDERVLNVIRFVAASNNSPTIEPALTEFDCDPLTSDYLGQSINPDMAVGRGLENYLPTHTSDNIGLAFLSTWTALRGLGRVDREGLIKIEADSSAIEVDNQATMAADMLTAAANFTFPGRQQSFSIEKLTGRKEAILLDGAHNKQSAIALAERVADLRVDLEIGDSKDEHRVPMTWVLAASDTKDVKEILSPLLEDGDSVYAVQFGPVDGMPWVKALDTKHLLNAARKVVDDSGSLETHDCGADVLGALIAASEKAAGGPMVVAGSLYLAGDVLRLLRDTE